MTNIQSEKLIKFMTKNKLTVDDVASITERQPKTVFAWRSNRIPPHWVMPMLVSHIESLKLSES